MASAEEYAKWIVDNSDKKGTEEFNTVAQAYQAAKGQTPQAAQQSSSGPTPVNAGLGSLGANLLGLPVDTAQNVYNLGKAAIGVASGRPQDFPLVEGTPGGSESIKAMMRVMAQKTGMQGLSPDNPAPGNAPASLAYEAVSRGAGIPSLTAPALGSMMAENTLGPQYAGLGTMAPGAAVQAARAAAVAPRNAVAGQVNRAFESPYAQQGLQNEAASGMTLTPGQVTGNPALLVAENAARQSFYTRSKVLKMDQRVAMQAIDKVNNLADEISVNKYSPGAMGETLQNALSGTVRKIDTLRDESAKINYGLVRQLGGDEPIITYGNTAGELNKIISEYKNVAGADAEKITAQATRMLDRVTKPMESQLPTNAQEYQAYLKTQGQIVPKTVTVDEAMKTRRFYSKAAAGSGNVFDEVAPNLNRELASRLAKAADTDFQVNGNGPVYDALKKANQDYAAHTQSIEYVQTSILGKLLGKDVADAAMSGGTGNTIAGETVAQKMLKMHPTEAETVSNILAQHAPNVLVDAKAYLIRDALAKGMDIKASAGANTIPLSYAKFIENLPKTDYLRAMRFSAKEIGDIKSTIDAMERAGDRTGYNQSQTAVISGFYNDLKSLASVSVRGGLSVAGQAAGLNKIADAMATPDGRAALRTIVTPGVPEKRVQQAVAIVLNMKQPQQQAPAQQPQQQAQTQPQMPVNVGGSMGTGSEDLARRQAQFGDERAIQMLLENRLGRIAR
jgi:hypothetical protein